VGDEMLVFEAGRIPQRGKPLTVLRQPVSENVARLFGYATFLQAEIVKLNPGADSSVLRILGREFCGSYFPGRLNGDRVMLCARPDELRLTEGPGPNRVPATVSGVEDRPNGVRLHLATNPQGSITVDVPRHEWEAASDRREQHIEIPKQALRALKSASSLKQ
jgi:ABC-type Fe3+/spermidine/putrescine transport system ATPase subunit